MLTKTIRKCETFFQSELANSLKCAELDREIAELREHISWAANSTSAEPNNSTLSDASQVQPGQSGNNAVSEPCASNSSCMIESMEIGCSHGMNGNALNGNVCSVITAIIVWQILPEFSLPTFTSRKHSALHILKAFKEYLKL